MCGEGSQDEVTPQQLAPQPSLQPPPPKVPKITVNGSCIINIYY